MNITNDNTKVKIGGIHRIKIHIEIYGSSIQDIE